MILRYTIFRLIYYYAKSIIDRQYLYSNCRQYSSISNCIIWYSQCRDAFMFLSQNKWQPAPVWELKNSSAPLGLQTSKTWSNYKVTVENSPLIRTISVIRTCLTVTNLCFMAVSMYVYGTFVMVYSSTLTPVLDDGVASFWTVRHEQPILWMHFYQWYCQLHLTPGETTMFLNKYSNNTKAF